MTHYFILVYIKKDVQIYSIILIINCTTLIPQHYSLTLFISA